MATEVNPQVVIAWVRLAQELSLLGINAANGIKNAVKAMNPKTTPAELDAIVRATQDDASRRKALAEADAAGLGPQPVHAAAAQPAAAATGVTGKLGPNGQPQAAQPLKHGITGPMPTPFPGAGPTGTDGVTGTSAANNPPASPLGKDGPHSPVDRPAGGLPGTTSAPTDTTTVDTQSPAATQPGAPVQPPVPNPAPDADRT